MQFIQKSFDLFLKTTILGFKTIWDLLKVMWPVLLVVKLLEYFGMIDVLGAALSPIMSLVGLPGSMGLVWASAILTNIYSGVAVLATLMEGGNITLSVAQVTVLMSMILVVHNIPVEQKIMSKTGLRLFPISIFRIFLGIVYGFLLINIYKMGNWLEDPLDLSFLQVGTDRNMDSFEMGFLHGMTEWLKSTIRLTISISAIIMGLVYLLKILDLIKITNLINILLGFAFKPLGIDKKYISLSVIGILFGISYGGSLMIQEIKNKKVPKKDVLLVMAFLSLSHALIEDTVLVLIAGAHASGVFWARLLFTYFAIWILNFLICRLNEETFQKIFFRKEKES